MVKICPKCGKENPDEAKFCINCGTELEAPQQPSLTVKPPPTVTVTKPLTTKPTPTPLQPPTITSTTVIRPPGMCFYHPSLPAKYICSRCGRPICEHCAIDVGGLILCPQCTAGIGRVTRRSTWWIPVLIVGAIAAALALFIIFYPF